MFRLLKILNFKMHSVSIFNLLNKTIIDFNFRLVLLYFQALGVCKIKAINQPIRTLSKLVKTSLPPTSTSSSTKTIKVDKSNQLKSIKSLSQFQPKLFGLRTKEALENIQSKQAKKFDQSVLCETKEVYQYCNSIACFKIDLLLVIDTSSSVFNAFHDELQLAQDLINGLQSDSFDKDLQVNSDIKFFMLIRLDWYNLLWNRPSFFHQSKGIAARKLLQKYNRLNSLAKPLVLPTQLIVLQGN